VDTAAPTLAPSGDTLGALHDIGRIWIKGGVPYYWNGTAWTAVGTVLAGSVTDLIITGSLVVLGTINSNANFSGAVGVDSDFDVNTDKFTVAAATGNTKVAGTLTNTGVVTMVSNATVGGTLSVTGAITGASLNTDNVALKVKLFTGTLDAGGDATITHGVTLSKIIGGFFTVSNGNWRGQTGGITGTVQDKIVYYATTIDISIEDVGTYASGAYRFLLFYEA
jgi:hypothetical protein